MQKEIGVNSKEIPAVVERGREKGCSVYLLIKEITGLKLQKESEFEAILPQPKLMN